MLPSGHPDQHPAHGLRLMITRREKHRDSSGTDRLATEAVTALRPAAAGTADGLARFHPSGGPARRAVPVPAVVLVPGTSFPEGFRASRRTQAGVSNFRLATEAVTASSHASIPGASRCRPWSWCRDSRAARGAGTCSNPQARGRPVARRWSASTFAARRRAARLPRATTTWTGCETSPMPVWR